ncbi:hypothetical protein [Pedobacter cryotolerans]|uniref:Uncharacterized protein n=1 Tax=Pedobacter cryotolerans TaxID=2571270 RepID=A0A4U1C5F7_9SPHI|nr:hypothetical protein [Pedobacter cryotolerans]TKB99700.1 hypothetical protein FA045_12395 [Pedobacter cryotolerans]
MTKKNDDNIENLPKLKECFIITPIGELNSEIYKKANGLINAVITPVLKEFGYEAIAAHQISLSGSINNQLIKKILESDLVIANLTGLNPNVMYELAIRHSARLPVVIMAEEAITPRLPFDITDQRTIFYEDTLAGSEAAKPILYSFVENALADEKPDNPVYAAATQQNIFKDLDEGNPLSIILDRIESLSGRIGNVSKSNNIITIYKDYIKLNIPEIINEMVPISNPFYDKTYDEVMAIAMANEIRLKGSQGGQNNPIIKIFVEYQKPNNFELFKTALRSSERINLEE